MADRAPPGGYTLTRDYLRSGALSDFIRRNNPAMRMLSDVERRDNLDAILAARPERGQGVKVFAYGSLIWNPAIHITARHIARVQGWRRDFCLATQGGRGTAENPGMLLGLQQGDDCVGAVLHVAEHAIEEELDILWRREMVADGYIPRWVKVESPDGAALGHAIAFTINPEGPSYCGPMPEADLVHRLATARGALGSAAEYLFNTRDGLRALGIIDPLLERLAMQVTALQASLESTSDRRVDTRPTGKRVSAQTPGTGIA